QENRRFRAHRAAREQTLDLVAPTLDASRQIGGGRRRTVPGDFLAPESGFRGTPQLGRKRGVWGDLHVFDADEADRKLLFALADAFEHRLGNRRLRRLRDEHDLLGAGVTTERTNA